MYRTKCATVLAVIAVLGMLMGAHAQVLTGMIFGSVKDESAAVLAGVTATITSPALPGGPQVAVTNAKGEYRFPDVPPGIYQLTLQLSGFNTYEEQGLRVTTGGTVERNVTVKVAAVSETVTVSGQGPVVDTRQTGVAIGIPNEKIESVPFEHYSLQDLAEMLPGVSPSSPGTDYGGQTHYIMGSLPNETAWLIDGAITNSPRNGSFWIGGDDDATQEAQVTAIGASAEYQIAQGGVLSFVTKSGTNTFAGSAAAYLRPDFLVSKPIKLNCNCPAGETGYTSKAYVDDAAHIGGPIVRDRIWFFGGAHWKGLTSLTPGQDPGPVPSGVYDHFYPGTVKVTGNITKSLRFMSMYEYEPWREPPFPDLANPIQTIPAYYGSSHTYSEELTAILPRATVLTVRATGFIQPNDGVATVGGDLTTPSHVDLLTGVASGGVSQISTNQGGRHGVTAKSSKFMATSHINMDLNGGFQSDRGSEYNGSALPGGVNYYDLGGRPNQEVYAPPSINGAHFNSWGVWTDNQLTAGRATFQLGLRYDHMSADSPNLPAIDNNLKSTGTTINGLGHMFTWQTWSPRAGFTVKLTGDSRTVLRGSLGRYYSPIFLDIISAVHPGISSTTTAQFDPATGGYTTILQVVNPLTNITVDRNAKPQYNDQYSIGVDREVGRNMGLTVSWVHKEGRQQLGWLDIGGVYAAAPAVLPNGQTLTALALVNQPSERRFLLTNPSDFFTKYNGLILALNKRYSERWLASIFYTYSKAQGKIPASVSSFTSFGFGQDPNDYINLAGRLANVDRPHIFNVQAIYQIPKIEVQLAPNFMWQSGVVYAAQAAVRLPQATKLINLESPGAYRTPTQYLLTLRVSKNVWHNGDRRVEAILDLRNLLQDEVYQRVLTRNFFSASFGQPSTWIAPRMAIVGARVNF